jgi:NADH:ubiquinone oxidoreductase subunit 3 (subunit A)
MILFCVTSIFSLIDCYTFNIILLSDNFECGFYPILMSLLKYKLNYWILTIYFMIFEQELILVLLLTFCIKTFNENIILCLLLGLLFLDLYFLMN